jgi:hypothetical protein
VISPATSASARRAELLTRLLLPALLVIALPLTLGACGAEEPSQARDDSVPDAPVDISGTDPVGQEIGGSVAPLAMCAEWNAGSEAEQLATIDELRTQLGPQNSAISVPELTDDEATEMFDNACEPSWAAGFRLYKLYARAVGFVELEREIEERQAD